MQWPLIDGEAIANAQRLKGKNNHILRHTNTVNHERRRRTTGARIAAAHGVVQCSKWSAGKWPHADPLVRLGVLK